MKEHPRIVCRFLIFKQTGVSHLVSLVGGILFFFLTVRSKNILTQKSIFCHDGQRRNASSVKEYFVFLLDCFASSDNNSTTRLPFRHNTIIAVSLSITLVSIQVYL